MSIVASSLLAMAITTLASAQDCSVCQERARLCDRALQACDEVIRSQDTLIEKLTKRVEIGDKQLLLTTQMLNDAQDELNSPWRQPQYVIPLAFVLGMVAGGLLLK